ncbi:LysR family transcriptional regulator [Ramlibacter sp.]|uniref:LysR family transcriptional regulator n=1 Tax=Ramlibacter sp. TaxID=1917967 RepID=UPI0035AF78B0
MELRQMRHLLALEETRSFSRAAQRLFITQSALSRSIQGLEAELGVRLVDRIGKRNELTPMGLAAAEHARRLVREADDLHGHLAQLAQGHMRSLSVGLGSGPGAVLMTPLLCELAAHQPPVRAVVLRGATELQLQQLRSRELDALVIDARRVAPATDLRIEPLGQLRAAFICRRGHPLARRRRVAFEDLLAYPVASTPLSDEVARQLVDQYGESAHPQLLTRLCCEEVESLLDTVRATDAIFLGICVAAREDLAAGRLLELPVVPALAAQARFALVTLAGRTEGPSVAFIRAFARARMRDD